MEPQTATARELEMSDLEKEVEGAESLEVPSPGDSIHLYFAAQEGWEIDRNGGRPTMTNGDYTIELAYERGMFKVGQIYGPGEEVPSIPQDEGPRPYAPPF